MKVEKKKTKEGKVSSGREAPSLMYISPISLLGSFWFPHTALTCLAHPSLPLPLRLFFWRRTLFLKTPLSGGFILKIPDSGSRPDLYVGGRGE